MTTLTCTTFSVLRSSIMQLELRVCCIPLIHHTALAATKYSA
jgi:hypothetical protein